MRDHSSVAVVGLSCRFPGNGATLEGFWESLCAGESAWSEIPQERFNKNAFWSPNKKRSTSATTSGHFLRQDIARFDASFFGLPKHDVDAMDPQQRIILEVAYEALERAGLPLEKLAGTRTGVFIGHLTSDYRDMICRDSDNAPVYTFTGTGTASAANRISWLWDLRGPSFTVNTACSSGLLALHLACQSLRTGESDIAIVGASSLLMNPEMFMFLSNQGFLSPDGKCKSFDESANGYGRGEGFGCLILKRTSDAISAGDPVRAIIRGTGSNQDGRTVGLTMPSSEAQKSLIEDVYQQAGLDPRLTTYVEAHGTGTKLGDVHEMSAVAATIAAAHDPNTKLLVGSVKPNIGHLEAAAGIAGVIKAVLMLENGLIPPNIHFQKGNPKIQFNKWKVEVPLKLSPWPTLGPRRASVNSFGYGGSNVHAVLESYEIQNCVPNPNHVSSSASDIKGRNRILRVGQNADSSGTDFCQPRLFLLSAQDQNGLKRLMKPLADYVQLTIAKFDNDAGYHRDKTENFMDLLAYTLSERRSRLQWKTHVIASSPEELIALLRARNDAETIPAIKSSRSPRVGFVFTGQGAQWPRMGAELMVYSAFRESIEAADCYLKDNCDCIWSVAEELFKKKEASLINQATYSHPLSCILQVALVDLLKTWHIEPVAVVGHSGGEIGAAYASGALSRENSWKIAYYRGCVAALMRTKAPTLRGSMMAVGLSHTETAVWFSKVTDGLLVVACINSPASTTVAGDEAAVDQLLGFLKAGGIFSRKLMVDTAYHSPHMALVAEEYRRLTTEIKPTARSVGGCAMYSTVTGGAVEPGQLDVDHWVASLTSPVKFSEAVYKMVQPLANSDGKENPDLDIIIEVGPHSTLQGPSMQSLKAHGISLPYHSSLKRNQNAIETALSVCGALYDQGYPVKVPEADGSLQVNYATPLVDLPTYPWNHAQRFWHDSRTENEFLSRAAPKASLIGAPMPSVVAGERVWRGFIRLSEAPWIADHKIQGETLYPGAGFIVMALEAAVQIADPNQEIASFKLRDIQLTSAVIVTEGADLEYTIQLRPHVVGTRDSTSTWTHFAIITSADGKSLVQNCCGFLIVEYEAANGSETSRERKLEEESLGKLYTEACDACAVELDMAKFYTTMRNRGLQYGSTFANVLDAQYGDGQSIGTVKIPHIPVPGLEGSHISPDCPYVIHPATLDAVFHLAFTASNEFRNRFKAAMVPRLIEEVTISTKIPKHAGAKLRGFSAADKHGLNELNASIVMFEDDLKVPIIRIDGFLCTEIAGASVPVSKTMLASKLTWKPAIDFLSIDEALSLVPGSTAETKLIGFCELMYHSHPALSVLEIASRHGKHDISVRNETPSIFQHMEMVNCTRTWDVAVASQNEMLPKAEDEQGPIRYVNLDRDILTESSQDTYDLILFSYERTPAGIITQICKAIKPDGKLCVLVTDKETATLQSVMTTNGLDINIWRQSEHDTGTSLVIARKRCVSELNQMNHDTGREIMLIQATKPTNSASLLASKLTEILVQRHYRVRSFYLDDDVSLLEGKSCISLLECEESLLLNINAEEFASLKSLLLKVRDLLWVTVLDDPASALIDGLVRVVRNETPGSQLRVLHADEPSCLGQSEGNLADLIVQTFFWVGDDNEFQVGGGLVHISRIDEDPDMSEEINSLLPETGKSVENVSLGEFKRPVKLCVRSPGMLNSLCLEPDDYAETELDHDYIEIDTKATALNFREIMVAMGQMADTALGLDAAGVVRRTGSSVTKFKVGDRIMMYGYGAHRTVHRSRAAYCALIPDDITFEQAASIPVVHATAWNALVRVAKVEEGQSILIHAAAGGVGQVAVQIAQHYKMDVFVTVSSDAKRELMRTRYGVANDHIFNSRDLSFAKGIKRMTGGRGVDVVLNSLAGEALRQTWHCIAPFGHFVEIGVKDILNNTGLDMQPFIQDATFTFFNLRHIDECRPDLMATILQGAFDFVRRGITHPQDTLTLHRFSISDVESAFRLMQSGKHLGKITLRWDDSHNIVPVIQGPPDSPKLSPTHVYLLVGGLGGIGRSLASKLARLGARKLCFLSRSGAESAKAKDLIRQLKQQSIQVEVYKCDVGIESEVSQAIKRCTHELGHIKGVFQCAMVLRDGLFAHMTHQRWAESTRPKVQGSWNLHKYLPTDLDFFIILSSFTGVFGSRGQSNYAAAGAYEDALAYHRRERGQRATTIDLGLMRDIGVLAETGITDAFREWEEPYGIRETQFLALIERVIYHEMAADRSPQVITGLATGGSAISAGIEKPYYLDDARFSIMAHLGLDGKVSTAATYDALPTYSLISQARSLQEASDGVLVALVKQVAKILQTEPSEIDTNKFLHSLGIDSLVAVEIVNWIVRETKSTITVFDVLAGVPITTLSGKIAARSAVLPRELVPL
ncbi:putative polyketide synthase [Nemania sp. FL0916]|nr:putative polyketide synthase [Nemania sp. FL0916]